MLKFFSLLMIFACFIDSLSLEYAEKGTGINPNSLSPTHGTC